MPALDQTQDADVSVQEQDAPRFTLLRVLGLICGGLLWLFFGPYLWEALTGREAIDPHAAALLLPPLAWALPLAALLLYARRWVEAICVLVLFPLAIFANLAASSVVEGLMAEGSMSGASGDTRMLLTAVVLSACWLALGLWPYRGLLSPGGMELSAIGRQLRKGAGLAEILVIVFILGIGYTYFSSFNDHGYSVRARVSELILAGSSAKTALSEGMQTFHSWSPVWMSSITISATGMVASAHIGPSGQITVYGTKAVSDAVVTMTPTVTTDDKLVWSCSGKPVKHMPASCR